MAHSEAMRLRNIVTNGNSPMCRLADLTQHHVCLQVIKLHKTVTKTERSAFYTTQGGFDTHATYDISDKMTLIDNALKVQYRSCPKADIWQVTFAQHVCLHVVIYVPI